MLFCVSNLFRLKKISLRSVLPHAIAVLTFFLVTLFFFSPLFFDNKTLQQHDITEYLGTSKELTDYRQATGEEALWAGHVFGGMPAYLISVDWSDGPVSYVKKIGALGLPHPVANIYWAFISFYILLLAFGVRPYLAIAGALSFGLSSFVIIGLGAGHNGRIGAMAYMPLVLAGIHLCFSQRRWLGAALAAMALALHLRENHLQMTYYLILIVIGYGLVQLADAVRNKTLPDFIKTAMILMLSAVMAAGTFFGQFWAVTEYSKYSIRGKSDLTGVTKSSGEQNGLTKSYAFEYSNGIWEPMTLMIPNIFGGSSFESLLSDDRSETYKVLSGASDQETANQLSRYTVAYWGDQPNTAPYYAGAVMIFLFFTGIFLIEKKWLWWLMPLSVFSVMMSWGDNFSAFNYILFDYLPGYNKFRSVTFALVIILIAIPLIGIIGLEKLFDQGINSLTRKKLIYGFGLTGGICFLLWVTGGFGDFMRAGEEQLPVWLTNAMKEDRIGLLRDDALRSFTFITILFAALYLNLPKYLSLSFIYPAIILLVLIDLWSFDNRYFSKDKYRRAAEEAVQMTDADQAILSDTSVYRVYNLQNPLGEARTSYFHRSLGGYHGAKMRRYQELFDSVLYQETDRLIRDAQEGSLNFAGYGALNMLNTRYITYGPGRDNVLYNEDANGPAWIVQELKVVNSAAEELSQIKEINTKTTAVVDGTRFKMESWTGPADSVSSVMLKSTGPRELVYESDLSGRAPVIFSEIYYPHGWSATIDDQPAEIFRANYILRGLWIPQGRHTIKFRFDPSAYVVGDRITMIFNWLVLVVFFAGVYLAIREQPTAHKKTTA